MSTNSKDQELNKILNDLKNDYLNQMEDRIKLLEFLTQNKNFFKLEQEYHKLKGTGKTYGFAKVSALSELLEKVCENASENAKSEELLQSGLILLKKYFKNTDSNLTELENDQLYIKIKNQSKKTK